MRYTLRNSSKQMCITVTKLIGKPTPSQHRRVTRKFRSSPTQVVMHAFIAEIVFPYRVVAVACDLLLSHASRSLAHLSFSEVRVGVLRAVSRSARLCTKRKRKDTLAQEELPGSPITLCKMFLIHTIRLRKDLQLEVVVHAFF